MLFNKTCRAFGGGLSRNNSTISVAKQPDDSGVSIATSKKDEQDCFKPINHQRINVLFRR